MGKLMNKLIIMLILASISFPSFADDAAKKKSIEELMTIMNMDRMMDSMYSQMDQMFMKIARDSNVKQTEMPIVKKYMKKLAAVMKKEVSWEKMKQPITKIYMKHFTEKEIKDLLAFYKSDTGKKMIAKMPVVMQESMMYSQSLLKGLMPKVMEISKEFEKELKVARNNK